MKMDDSNSRIATKRTALGTLQLCKNFHAQPANKRITFADGIYRVAAFESSKPKWITALPPVGCASTTAYFAAIRAAAHDPSVFMLHGALVSGVNPGDKIQRTKATISAAGKSQRAFFEERPISLVARDFDIAGPSYEWCRSEGLDVFADPVGAVRAVIARFAPELVGVRLLIQMSNSAGFRKGSIDRHAIKFHAFHALSAPALPRALELDEVARRELLAEQGMAARAGNGSLIGPRDPAALRCVQPIFIADPTFDGCADPIPSRWFEIEGREAQDLTPLTPRRKSLLAPLKKPTRESAVQRTAREGENARRAEHNAKAHKPTFAAWPQNWRQVLNLLGHKLDGTSSAARRGFHNVLFIAVNRYLEENLRVLRRMTEAQREAELVSVTQIIGAAVDAAPSHYGADKRAVYKTRAAGDLQKRYAVLAQGPQTTTVYHPDKAVPAIEARRITAEAVRSYFDRVKGFHEAWTATRNWALPSGDGALSVAQCLSLLDTRGAASVDVLAAGRGCGKTWALADELAKRRIADHSVFVVFSDTVALGHDFSALYGEACVRHGYKAEPALVVEGLERVCAAFDETRKDEPDVSALTERVTKVQSASHTVSEFVCPTCPFAATCAYPAQVEAARKPGVVVAASAAITTAFPAVVPQRWNPAQAYTNDVQVPVYGAAIDEAVWSKQVRGVGNDLVRLPVSAFTLHHDSMKFGRPDYSDPASVDSADVKAIAAALRKFAESDLTWCAAGACGLSHGWMSWARATLEDFAENHIHRGVLRKEVADALGAGRDVKPVALARRDRLRFMVEMLGVMLRQPNNQTGPVVGIGRLTDYRRKESAAGEAAIELKYCKPLPPWLYSVPVLALDGSQDERLAKIVFNDCERFQILRVRSVAAEASRALRVKVLNAPVAMRALRDPMLNNAGEYAGERLHRDTAPESVWCFLAAIGARAGSIGVVSYKETTKYWDGKALPGAGFLHFGADRGRNDFAAAPAMAVVGRALPSPHAIEDIADALATLSATPKPVYRGGFIKAQRGLRLGRHWPEGIAVEVDSHSDEFADFVLRHVVNGQQEQSIDRDRATDPNRAVRCVTFDLSDTCPDVTYDLVVDWKALKIDEAAAMLHGLGYLPEGDAAQLKAAPWLFDNRKAMEKLRVRAAEKTFKNQDVSDCCTVGETLSGDLHKNGDIGLLSISIQSMSPFLCTPAKDPSKTAPRGFRLTDETVLAGHATAIPLLTPPCPQSAEITTQYPNRTKSTHRVILDANRPDAASRFAAQLGRKLVDVTVSEIPASLPVLGPPGPVEDDTIPHHSEMTPIGTHYFWDEATGTAKEAHYATETHLGAAFNVSGDPAQPQRQTPLWGLPRRFIGYAANQWHGPWPASLQSWPTPRQCRRTLRRNWHRRAWRDQASHRTRHHKPLRVR